MKEYKIKLVNNKQIESNKDASIDVAISDLYELEVETPCHLIIKKSFHDSPFNIISEGLAVRLLMKQQSENTANWDYDDLQKKLDVLCDVVEFVNFAHAFGTLQISVQDQSRKNNMSKPRFAKIRNSLLQKGKYCFKREANLSDFVKYTTDTFGALVEYWTIKEPDWDDIFSDISTRAEEIMGKIIEAINS